MWDESSSNLVQDNLLQIMDIYSEIKNVQFICAKPKWKYNPNSRNTVYILYLKYQMN